jgi:hypothetical protein
MLKDLEKWGSLFSEENMSFALLPIGFGKTKESESVSLIG